MAETLSQYKSNLTPEEVDQALHNIAQLDDGIAQAKQYAEQAQGYAESIDPGNFYTKEEADARYLPRSFCPYDVGDILTTSKAGNPSQRWPGTSWQQIKDVFLLAAGDTYTAGSTGGEATHALTGEENGPHTHNVNIRMSGVNTSREAIVPSSYSWTNTYEQTSPAVDILQSSGSGTPHNNMPPYLAVYMWQRTA